MDKTHTQLPVDCACNGCQHAMLRTFVAKGFDDYVDVRCLVLQFHRETTWSSVQPGHYPVECNHRRKIWP